MNLRQIEVFRAVMGTGSMTEAAQMLHIAQPGVSRMIRHLEIQLGVTLFERHRGRLVPTAEARTLQGEVERVYRGVRQVQDVAQHLRHGSDAPLRVLASANVALQLVPDAIARLVAERPRNRIVFESLPPREMAARLVAEAAEVGISSGPIEHPSLDVREIGRWTLACALPVDHPMAAQTSPRLSALLRERLILYGPDAPQSPQIDRWLDQYGIARNVAVEVRSGWVACAMAAAGVGIALVDDLSARAYGTRGLVYRRLRRAASFPIFSVVNVHRPLSASGRALLEQVQQELDRIAQAGLWQTLTA